MPGAERGPGRRGRRQRLSRSADFDRVYREGRSHANRHLVVYAFPRSDGDDSSSDAGADPRLGVSVGRKVGGAVERTRVKRLLREAFWATASELPDGHDFVIVARPPASELADQGGERAIEESLLDVLRSAGLAPEKAA
jgi:ribonuclease P protein component